MLVTLWEWHFCLKIFLVNPLFWFNLTGILEHYVCNCSPYNGAIKIQEREVECFELVLFYREAINCLVGVIDVEMFLVLAKIMLRSWRWLICQFILFLSCFMSINIQFLLPYIPYSQIKGKKFFSSLKFDIIVHFILTF